MVTMWLSLFPFVYTMCYTVLAVALSSLLSHRQGTLTEYMSGKEKVLVTTPWDVYVWRGGCSARFTFTGLVTIWLSPLVKLSGKQEHCLDCWPGILSNGVRGI